MSCKQKAKVTDHHIVKVCDCVPIIVDLCLQVICPTHNSTFDLLTAMIDQVVALHPDIKYLHIGCDEVYYLGECVRCGLTMVDHQWNKKQLFLHHVSRLAK